MEGMSEQELEGVELLLRDPQVVAWLELEETEDEERE
jgi:hypothetical protein